MRTRRPPPPLQLVTVADVVRVNPRLVRIVFTGDLAHYEGVAPAASLRLLVGGPGEPHLPEWNGNEYLLTDGTRPPIRTLTPLRPTGRTLEVEIVDHGRGAVSSWAADAAAPGQWAALSGPGRGYEVPDAPDFLIAGDESAVPAIGQLLESLPPRAQTSVHVEAAEPAARVALARDAEWHFGASTPGEAIVDAARSAAIGPSTRVWVAGEAAAVQRVRRHLFEERGIARPMTWVRGYWKHGRAGDADDEVV
ncbi:MAG TPA: siderophore-interacting protein [Acidimicrobiales bacterium]|nr:siderophore-interacting protein [Acidimicrobiales bacterium]